MQETCKSCGTIFYLDESIITNKIQWLECSVCNEKWRLSDKKNADQDDELKSIENNLINETEKVKNELASIKGINRNPNNKLIATGFYFYNKDSKSFFEKCLEHPINR